MIAGMHVCSRTRFVPIPLVCVNLIHWMPASSSCGSGQGCMRN